MATLIKWIISLMAGSHRTSWSISPLLPGTPGGGNRANKEAVEQALQAIQSLISQANEVLNRGDLTAAQSAIHQIDNLTSNLPSGAERQQVDAQLRTLKTQLSAQKRNLY